MTFLINFSAFFTVRSFNVMWLNASHLQSLNLETKTYSMQFWKRIEDLAGRPILLETLWYVFRELVVYMLLNRQFNVVYFN